jgi:hypothetical protein
MFPHRLEPQKQVLTEFLEVVGLWTVQDFDVLGHQLERAVLL